MGVDGLEDDGINIRAASGQPPERRRFAFSEQAPIAWTRGRRGRILDLVGPYQLIKCIKTLRLFPAARLPVASTGQLSYSRWPSCRSGDPVQPGPATLTSEPSSLSARPSALPPYTRRLLLWSFAIGVLPPLVLIVAVASKSLYLLTFIHVISGGTWTGFDIFMGVIMSRVLRTLDVPARVEVAKRLTPTTFFILPSLAAVAVTAGIYLAQTENKFDLSSPWIIAALVVVLILTAQGFGIFMPNGVRIFIELAKVKPDTGLIARLNMRNVRLSGVQALLQVLILLIMAHLAVY